MKLTNRFLEPIPLDLIEDAKDGSRVAMRPEAQTFSGIKTFEALRVASDPDKGDKSLVNVADMEAALTEAGTPLYVMESVTLTAADIAVKGVTLQGTPSEGTVVELTLEGSGVYRSVVDFSVTGQAVSWAENSRLCDILYEDDELYFRYHTVKEAA